MKNEMSEVKAILSVYVNSMRKFDKLLQRRKETYDRAIYTSPQFNRTGGKKNGPPDRLAERLANVDKIDRELLKIATESNQQIDDVQNLINLLYPDFKTMLVLEYRYINGSEWVDIANALDLSLSHVFNVHKTGLKALKEKIDRGDSAKNFDQPGCESK